MTAGKSFAVFVGLGGYRWYIRYSMASFREIKYGKYL
jgi:hypothetical protein